MSEPTLSLRERKKRETERRLLHAGRELFQTQGYDETSIEAIAEAADVSRATFFNYFTSKEALLTAIAAEEVRSLRRLLDEDLASVASPVERARRVMELLINDTVPYLHITRLVLVQVLRSPQDVPSPIQEMERLLAELAAEAQQRGEIRSGPAPQHVARALIGIYLAAFFGWVAEGHNRQDALGEEIEALADVLFFGIAPTSMRGASRQA